MTGWLLLYGIVALTVIANFFLKMAGGVEQKHLLVTGLLILTFANLGFSFVIKSVPVGVAYAMWSGLGITCLTLMGWVLFKEHLNWTQIMWIAVILVGCVGLNLSTMKSASVIS